MKTQSQTWFSVVLCKNNSFLIKNLNFNYFLVICQRKWATDNKIKNILSLSAWCFKWFWSCPCGGLVRLSALPVCRPHPFLASPLLVALPVCWPWPFLWHRPFWLPRLLGDLAHWQSQRVNLQTKQVIC